MSKPQSASNLFRVDPPYHLLLLPFFLLTLLVSVLWATGLIHPAGWVIKLLTVLLAAALLLMALKLRMYATALQDRVIRLEEQMRIHRLLVPAEAEAAVERLSMQQLIALRFASDAELPALVTRTLGEGLTPQAIKQAVVSWRADLARV